ncbi:MAG: prolyl oligopeptidase family serine peptidase [Actinobacteria bacterium]|nr:prolyl oligopeptidase family serine peptidase [Actinomycetota bacterium]
MSSHRARFFKNEDFEFSTEILLGSAAYGGSEVGDVLATVAAVKDGDFESWCEAWTATAERVEGEAAAAAAAGNRETAFARYLRASSYWFAAGFYVLGTKEGGEEDLRRLWRRHRDCFESAAEHAVPAWERVRIPFEGTELEGWLFRARPSGEPAPLLILNNGSDGTVTDMWLQGGAAGVARGYDCLTFDGPGQGQALYEQGLHFRADWEKVVTPVVDWALARDEFDPGRIALLGVSQGGYWVPRALAFENRIAAGVADPGVVDVSGSMTAHLSKGMRKQLAEGEKDKFDSQIHLAEHFSKSLRFTIKFRTFPYGTDSAYEMFKAAAAMRLDEETVGQIGCPVLIADPEHEQFWPGQSAELAAMLGDRATLLPFTAAEGADGHCEPKAPTLRAERIFDWLDRQLG